MKEKFKLPEEARKQFAEMDKKYGIRYWAKDGTPMSMAEWCEKFEDNEYRRVGLYQSWLLDVSTVWLGMDHSFNSDPKHKPIIFETMVFPKLSPRGCEIYCQRYATLQEAEDGHKYAIRLYKNRIDKFLLIYLDWFWYRAKQKGRMILDGSYYRDYVRQTCKNLWSWTKVQALRLSHKRNKP
jgi:hypothetical protein